MENLDKELDLVQQKYMIERIYQRVSFLKKWYPSDYNKAINDILKYIEKLEHLRNKEIILTDNIQEEKNER